MQWTGKERERTAPRPRTDVQALTPQNHHCILSLTPCLFLLLLKSEIYGKFGNHCVVDHTRRALFKHRSCVGLPSAILIKLRKRRSETKGNLQASRTASQLPNWEESFRTSMIPSFLVIFGPKGHPIHPPLQIQTVHYHRWFCRSFITRGEAGHRGSAGALCSSL